MKQTQNPSIGSTVSLVLFSAALFVIGAACLAFIWKMFLLDYEAGIVQSRDRRVNEARASIVDLDEKMTMAANLAAVTGDAEWERRYREYAPQLDLAIKSSGEMRRSGDKLARSVRGEGETGLTELEDRALALAREGKLEESRQILFSPEYQERKERYAQNIQWYTMPNDKLIGIKDRWGDLIHYRGLLSMAAQMAVTTGEAQWEKTHREFKTKLYGALREILEHSSEIKSEKTVRGVEAANFEMTRFENDAIEASRQGDKQGGMAILSSDAYLGRKSEYENGMAVLASKLTQSAYPTFNPHRREPVFYLTFAGFLIATLAFIWIYVLRLAMRAREAVPAPRKPLFFRPPQAVPAKSSNGSNGSNGGSAHSAGSGQAGSPHGKHSNGHGTSFDLANFS